jgi:hypothetical protein
MIRTPASTKAFGRGIVKMAKASAKKMKAPALMLVVMKKGEGKKGRGKGGCEDDDMEEYRKGGMVRKPKKKGPGK